MLVKLAKVYYMYLLWALFFWGWIGDIISILLDTFKDNTGAPLRATSEQNNSATEVKIVNPEVIHKTGNEEDNITKKESLSKLKEQGILTE